MDGVLVVIFANFTADSEPLSQLKLPILETSQLCVWPSNTCCCFILCPPFLEGFHRVPGTSDDCLLVGPRLQARL